MHELRNPAKPFCQNRFKLDETIVSNEDFEEEDYHRYLTGLCSEMQLDTGTDNVPNDAGCRIAHWSLIRQVTGPEMVLNATGYRAGLCSVMRLDSVQDVVLKRGWLRKADYSDMRKESGYRTLFCNAAGYRTGNCSGTPLGT